MATPTLALIPTGYKAGKLYSVLPESGVGDFTVVRATEATRVNEEGLIETMGANVPRLDYSGGGCPVLLTEPQRTNLITYSEDFSDSSWDKSNLSVTSNAIISPNGALNADKLIPTSVSGTHRAKATLATVNGDYTLSIFAKKGEYKNILLWDDSIGGGVGVNLDDLSVFRDVNNQGYKIEDYGNGWIRISIDLTYASQQIRFATYVYDNSATPQITFVGNDSDGLYIYGAQLEANASYPTSYIKTEGSAVTRNADQVNGAGDAATFNDSEGVLMAEISTLANDLTNRRISISNGTTSDNDRINLMYTSASNQIVINYKASGTTRVSFSYTLNDVTDYNKVLMLYKSGDFRFYVNGFKLDTDSNTTMIADGTLSELAFEDATNGNPFYGNTKQIQYFNSALTDSELETLTSWTSFIEMAQAQNYNII